jgi:pyruvate kinase
MATLSHLALAEKFVQYGHLVVSTSGIPFGIVGTTNTMTVESIGEVLVRAKKGIGKQIHGKVVILHAPQSHTVDDVRGKIVILSHCDETYLPLLQHALGIVLQNHPEDKVSEREALKAAKALDIPIVLRADGALAALRDGQVVTLDPEKRVVYKGASPQ